MLLFKSAHPRCLLRLFHDVRMSAEQVCAQMRQKYDEYVYNRQNFGYDRFEIISEDKIFANREVKLENIDYYGFDYDYTLAIYTKHINNFIYDEATRLLVDKYNYPQDIVNYAFDQNFAIRGLHYDISRGILLKMDCYNNLQVDTALHGATPLDRDVVEELYDGRNVELFFAAHQKPRNGVSGGAAQEMKIKLSQLMDFFVLPEYNLLSNVLQYFKDKNIDFNPEYLYHDVTQAISFLHTSGILHNEISKNLDKYLHKYPSLIKLIQKLKRRKKQMFIITNSKLDFVDKGMTYLLETEKWHEYFEVIVVQANKPAFFMSSCKPFRRLENGNATWSRVEDFKDHRIFQEVSFVSCVITVIHHHVKYVITELQGNIWDFNAFTGWNPKRVLYFGDHIYSDLADVSASHGWKTGAIIPELISEIRRHNTLEFQRCVWARFHIERLIDEFQDFGRRNVEAAQILHAWNVERVLQRIASKVHFNSIFGSMFRSFHNQTHFSQRLLRYADLYTARLSNLLHYSAEHRFYVKRTNLPHENSHFL